MDVVAKVSLSATNPQAVMGDFFWAAVLAGSTESEAVDKQKSEVASKEGLTYVKPDLHPAQKSR